jgi:hypothetical protein
MGETKLERQQGYCKTQAHNVSSGQKEDCSCSASKVGKGQAAKESGLKGTQAVRFLNRPIVRNGKS